jgi:hypothetical protein
MICLFAAIAGKRNPIMRKGLWDGWATLVFSLSGRFHGGPPKCAKIAANKFAYSE